MAATGFTPISLYHSSTPGAEPTSGNLVNGELAINIADGKLYYKDNTGTIKSFSGSTATYTRTSFTATGGQTTFTVTYAVGFVQVFLNGVLLNGADFTATNGTTVVLASGATAGDIVETIAYNIAAVGTASTATNIAGGIASQIVYQASAGSTAFIPNGTSGQALVSNGTSAPSFGTLSVAGGGTGLTTLTTNNVLLGNGTSAVQAVAPGTTGNVLTSNGTTWTSAAAAPSAGVLTAVASGSLANGDRVIVNSDGTVSVVQGSLATVFENATTENISATYDSNNNRVVIAYRDLGNSNFGTAIVGTVSGTSISFGTAVVFESATTTSISATFDSTNSRVVIAYKDEGNSDFGTAIVGTVSGTSISFGTAVVFESATTDNISTTFSPTSNRVVIAYRDLGNSNFGTAIVGTVSGTSISFGTPVVFQSVNALTTSATFDSTNNRVVIAYRNFTTSSRGQAVVGTISGTSISFGTPVVFATSATAVPSATYDSTNNRVVIAYRNDSVGSAGTAIVGTVSGTSISFGTAVVFSVSNIAESLSATFDSTNSKIIIAYQDAAAGDFGTAVVGTVSGTSISFGTPVVFESAVTGNIQATFNSTNSRVVIAYKDVGNSDFGTAIALNPNLQLTNLTATNFIGISNAAYTNGQTATIQIVGSVDDAQSGLTAGLGYFVLVNGALSTTAGSPSVFAGTAVSATQLIVKG